MLQRPLKLKVKKRPPTTVSAKSVIGWREWVSLPTLGISKIKAKIDTGAKTSALHAYDVHAVKKNGRSFVKFKVHPIQKNTKRIVECEAPLLEWRQVTDSSGRRTVRPVIRTILEVGDIAVEAEVTLIARDQMGFRMLVGRQALKNKWLVNPSKSFIGAGKLLAKPRKSTVKALEEE